MKTYSYTSTRTRTEAVVDQFDIFLQYAGISEARRTIVLAAVDRRLLDKVGVYLVDADEKRVLEVAVEVDWSAHADFAAISPHIRTDLPGWESGAAPEIRTLGRRFGMKAQASGRTPRHWVVFTASVRNDPNLHRKLCGEMGYKLGGAIAQWRNPPGRAEDRRLLDLDEVSISIAEA